MNVEKTKEVSTLVNPSEAALKELPKSKGSFAAMERKAQVPAKAKA